MATIDDFSPNFRRAFTHAMKWETGLPIDYSDPEIVAGLIATPEQRRKVGYTDGVSGASKFDSGGETKFGVAQTAHMNPYICVRTLDLAGAMQCYKQGYWDAVKGDELPPDVARYVFDIGCGSGPHRAITMLQSCLGVSPDGVLGPQTLAAASSFGQSTLVAKLEVARIAYYESIARSNPSQNIFLKGWINRASDLS